MAKTPAGPTTAAFQCTVCGWRTSKWAGRCGECQEWGTVEQTGAPVLPRAGLVPVGPGQVSTPAVPIGQVDATAAGPRPTGLGELDRVLGGGLVPGAVILLAGEPGVGKSTLLLEACAQAAGSGPVLYVTAEESAGQVRLRADRVGAIHPSLFLAAETGLAALLGHVETVRPGLLIVDSVQTVAAPEVEGVPGGVTQVRAVAAALAAVAKERMMTTVLVGHVTKDGAIAGPRALEHLVDVVLYFEGERHSQLRIVRAVKNRYGPTDEIGVFEMTDAGLAEVPNPSALFLGDRQREVAGSAVFAGIEGTRPMLVEIQALVAPSAPGTPRRAVVGWDGNRLAMVLAVLEARCGVAIGANDIYLNVAGGLRVAEPAADLAVAAALVSALAHEPVPADMVVFGEIGLSGEIRPVSQADARLKEAEKLGFATALMPTRRGRSKDRAAPVGTFKTREIAHLKHLLGLFENASHNLRRAGGGGGRS